jgi:hypothetical protein
MLIEANQFDPSPFDEDLNSVPHTNTFSRKLASQGQLDHFGVTNINSNQDQTYTKQSVSLDAAPMPFNPKKSVRPTQGVVKLPP